MDLYLLRHAQAEDFAESDFARRLTEKGEKQADKVAKFCRKEKIFPQMILTSPLERARRTAEILVTQMPGVEWMTVPFLASGMHPETALAELAVYKSFERVMIVGHEPDFSYLIGYLLDQGGSSVASVHVGKASLILLRVVSLRAGGAQLQFSIPAKFL